MPPVQLLQLWTIAVTAKVSNQLSNVAQIICGRLQKNQQSNLLLNKDKVIEMLDLEHPCDQIR